jgi:hypothetical protein
MGIAISLAGWGVSKSIHKCPACSRRVKRAPYIALTDRKTRRQTRYHGSAAPFFEAGVLEAQRRGPHEIMLGFYHTMWCGDPAGKMSCRGGCFAVNESTAQEGAA